MPELPEVEVTRQGMLPLLGKTVAQVVIRNASMRWPIPLHLVETLVGANLSSLNRRAKYILATFEGGLHDGILLLHLGMSGRLCVLAHDEPAQKHDHFDLHFTDGSVLRLRDPRRFGAVLWQERHGQEGHDVSAHPLIRVLGPEPLLDAFDASYLHTQLKSRTQAIKLAIMDSHLVVGVGNIYASESLFRAGISPKRAAKSLSKKECTRLVAEIKATLSEAISVGGSSLRDFFGADGNPGYFQQTYFAYARAEQPCKQCDGFIRQIKQGQRSTFYCPNCQN